MQQILGADVIATRAVGHRGVDQYREGRAAPLKEIAGQPLERRIARVQRRGGPALGREQFGEPADPPAERLRRLVSGDQRRTRVGDVVDPALHHGLPVAGTDLDSRVLSAAVLRLD